MSAQLIKRYSMRLAKPSSQIGGVVVELAFVIVVMLVMFAGIIEFGRAFWYANALSKATRDGSRLMSTWPSATISSQGVGAARNLVINAANAANVSPPLTTDYVQVDCLNAAFTVVGCADGTAPANVNVTITGFSISIGSWLPFIIGPASGNFGDTGLTPHLTMRYMN